MPIVPQTFSLEANATALLNAIRGENGVDYQSRVPEATQENMREVGTAIMNFDPQNNPFLRALVNRIGLTLITSRSYQNPLRQFKKGIMELGETIQEVFVNAARSLPFNPEQAYKNIFKRHIPDVSAAYHTMNFQVKYPTTISENQLRQAFVTSQGLFDLVSAIVESLYTGSEIDEFACMKELIAKAATEGRMFPVMIPDYTDVNNLKAIITAIKGTSNKVEFPNTIYNETGVISFSKKDRQILIMDAMFDASVDVNVLASAFNMDKAQFMGQRVVVDNFNELVGVPCVLVDRDFFMVVDNLIKMADAWNGDGLYWNYFYHTWKTFASSPFVTAVLFTTTPSKVTGITLYPAGQQSRAPGDLVEFTATVETTGYAPKGVLWTINSALPTTSKVDWTGRLLISTTEKNSEITVVATSVFDNSITASTTIEIVPAGA